MLLLRWAFAVLAAVALLIAPTAPVPASGDAFTHAVVAESERRGIGIVSFWRSIPLDALPPPATDRNEETSAHNYGNR